MYIQCIYSNSKINPRLKSTKRYDILSNFDKLAVFDGFIQVLIKFKEEYCPITVAFTETSLR